MNILQITDSHGTVKAPDSRTDLYYLTFLRKLAEITYVIKMQKIDIVLHTGDLFHISRVSNKFMGQVAEIIKGWGIPVYIVPGNHDIDGYSLETIDQTSLGLLSKTNVFKLLTRQDPIRINAKSSNGQDFTVAISGQEYYSQIDTGNMQDFEMQQPDGDINILAIHGYIADTPQHPNIRCTYPKDIITDADIILSGHYHRSFALTVGDTDYYNPGSMVRVEMTEYNKTHMPQYGVLNLDLDDQGYVTYNYKFHQFRVAKPGNEVFDYNVSTAIKSHSVTLENFKTSISNTMQTVGTQISSNPLQTINDIIQDYSNAQAYNAIQVSSLLNEASYYYTKAANQITDEDVIVTQGFIPSQTPIKIRSVDIKNFQSHENTHIDFTDGLNIIIGETNKGKTSIFRAIMWVIDNQPLGTDFIMEGKNDCTVRVTYDNDAYIERYRTLKDTGYYKIWDGNPSNVEQEFRGFTNSIPVEVMNVHQMPKISLTKNIETHLNYLGQLERPFLITESTNEKAAAIGRITGTNIVDTAIKSISDDITYDNRDIKTSIKQKEDLVIKEKSYNMQNLIELKKFYTLAKASIENLNIQNVQLLEIKNNKTLTDTGLSLYGKQITNCEVIIADKNDIEKAEQLSFSISSAILLLNKYKNNKEIIKKQEELITKCNDIITNKSVIESCYDSIYKMHNLFNLKSNKDRISSNISNTKTKAIALTAKQRELSSVSKQEEKVAFLNQLLKLYRQVENINSKIQIINNDSINILNTVSGLNSELDIAENELKDYVLSVDVCPCCGQKITSKNVTSIINNFSKEG